MIPFDAPPPLSLYVHIPWCLRKCPYCDFNAHTHSGELPVAAYLKALMADLHQHHESLLHRPFSSIFIGGGTPSLMPGQFYQTLIQDLHDQGYLASREIEITLEANPGTFEQTRFSAFRDAGINRLSLGIQSFQDDKLKALGRIHMASQAEQAILGAQQAGFRRMNVDLMHGLPHQTPDDALYDLNTALSYGITHLSWYELTLEPNTVFGKHPPPLPHEDILWQIQTEGERYLVKQGFERYEISAFCRPGEQGQHNVNYWQFGDYLGIGAGAHSKLTNLATGTVTRFQKKRQPASYLADQSPIAQRYLTSADLLLEFMLNALRLPQGFALSTFYARTGLRDDVLRPALTQAIAQGFLTEKAGSIAPTPHGLRFLNNCLALFRA